MKNAKANEQTHTHDFSFTSLCGKIGKQDHVNISFYRFNHRTTMFAFHVGVGEDL